ncbi:MAG: carboxypeptidase-like regulatory domain-containing protein [Alistipes onderdonkii]
MAGPAGAQTKGHKVVGTVMGPDSLPLQGATVIIKEVNRGAVSDSKGRYVLSNVPPTASLVFSFLGMVSQEVPVGQKTEINVVLTATDARLDEVVVVGYSEVKYKDLTGSVGRANVGDMLKTDAGNIGEAFAGRVAGVQVTSNEGMPGEEMNIVIRGSNSVTQSTRRSTSSTVSRWKIPRWVPSTLGHRFDQHSQRRFSNRDIREPAQPAAW